MPNIINQSNNNVKVEALKIVFLGTSQFAVPILEKLAQSYYKPVAVFTAPDKLVGRQQVLTPLPVKIIAQKHNIPVHQPKNISELIFQLPITNYQLLICTAYGLILSKEILEVPKFGCLNIHPSLLPKYRGPSPIQYTILNGDKETGVSIIKMTEKVDAGPIIVNCKLPLGPEFGVEGKIENLKYTTPELSQTLAGLGAQLLMEALPDWLAGKIQPQPQNESQASYTKIIKKEDGLIDWQKSAQQIERQIRAFTPWPGSYTSLKFYPEQSRRVKILEADVLKTGNHRKPGEIFLIQNNKLSIQTGDGVLFIKNLQPEGGKPMSARNFLCGHREILGQVLT